MKPDWSKAPEWANWAAQEASGSWYWYSERPTYSEICTEWQTKGRREIIPRVDVRPQATLEERPQEQFKFWEGSVTQEEYLARVAESAAGLPIAHLCFASRGPNAHQD